MQVRTILVPVDFSDPAAAALDAATELAKRFGARVRLLHVYPLDTAIYPYGLIISEDVERKLRETAQQKLDEWCDRAVAAGVEAEATVVSGAPAEAILQMARDLPADLVVMGTRGLSGLKHVMLGSVAERTVRLAPCPVLTLHQGD
jgi:nucleotide-binding universal stress UspA family protein